MKDLNFQRRPNEPETVTMWREWIRTGPPKCCFTCDFYNDDGSCVLFDMTPPAEFAEQIDACPSWIEECPF